MSRNAVFLALYTISVKHHYISQSSISLKTTTVCECIRSKNFPRITFFMYHAVSFHDHTVFLLFIPLYNVVEGN